MIIKQGYISSTIKGFNLLEQYHLRNYDNLNEPLVMFGCYNKNDYALIDNHKSSLVIVWCGADALRIKENVNFFKRSNITHVTSLLKIHELLNNKGIVCHLTKIIAPDIPKPTILGNKVYTYLNKNHPQYYGSKIVDELKNKYDILVGDLSISQEDWRNGECEKYYSQAFIGLALSSFGGGGYTIVEMGLRGIKVITNVMKFPHTIKWNNTKDIENAINKEKENIGKINNILANEVYNSMIVDMEYYDLDKILNKN